MLSILNKIATQDHNSCEDSFLLIENDGFIVSAVFDGCSTGKDSVFASHLFVKIMRKYFLSYNYGNFSDFDLKQYVLVQFKRRLKLLASLLELKENELWATIVITLYNKETKQLKLLVVGDGCYKTNWDEELQIVDQNDKLDYIASHLAEKDTEIIHFYKEFRDVTEFLISSDGIKSYSLPQHKTSNLEPVSLLLSPNGSANHLVRKYNMLHKQGWLNKDDITIIAYHEDIR